MPLTSWHGVHLSRNATTFTTSRLLFSFCCQAGISDFRWCGAQIASDSRQPAVSALQSSRSLKPPVKHRADAVVSKVVDFACHTVRNALCVDEILSFFTLTEFFTGGSVCESWMSCRLYSCLMCCSSSSWLSMHEGAMTFSPEIRP
jgi:hypothetical protein